MDELSRYLERIDYPGRGCALGVAPDGTRTAVYWVTGRSDASRKRRVRTETDHVVIEDSENPSPTDPLRHYTSMVLLPDRRLIVGNGTHVDGIAAATARSADLLRAFAEHEFEPDAPLRTPRIGGVCGVDPATGTYDVAVGSARSSAADPDRSEHVVRRFADVPPGAALAVSTYSGTVDHVVADGLPQWVRLPDGPVAPAVWQSLPEELRVAVVAVEVGADLTDAAVCQ